MSFEEFDNDSKTVDAVVRNLEVIGEATNNVPQNIRDKYPEIPWHSIVGIRNKIAHEYFGIDNEIIWETILHDIPGYKKQIQKILDELG